MCVRMHVLLHTVYIYDNLMTHGIFSPHIDYSPYLQSISACAGGGLDSILHTSELHVLYCVLQHSCSPSQPCPTYSYSHSSVHCIPRTPVGYLPRPQEQLRSLHRSISSPTSTPFLTTMNRAAKGAFCSSSLAS